VLTTYRLTEHHTAGGMSRTVAYLSELQPELFCEVSPELAAERHLEHLGWATIVTSRTAVEARVLVTERLAPLRVQGRTLHQVGLPYHWGGKGLTTGDSANDLFPIVLDPNVHIQEVKAATCDIRPGRRPRGAALTGLVEQYRSRAGIHDQGGPARTVRCRRPSTAGGTRPPWPATASTRRGSGSSPTPRSASAARPARSPARNGTWSPTTD